MYEAQACALEAIKCNLLCFLNKQPLQQCTIPIMHAVNIIQPSRRTALAAIVPARGSADIPTKI